ncbi:uncharacterized protein PHALS_08975 [Plasmopara halstedii]|uniref:Bacterial Ig domain-containing protein n=1 Tax=Plasmopara halstedii TaxID=4781 RepID=A0A0P1ADP5_PLAHL|nr:uncharacterized protein PHALS_08975 [Plasmopara halstedii]CEG38930.1 hypothetical protein PHALS_08975 [Plasmopara halstedii]|eukprot:XP_024575299.1 hypothetical protein PHALS_08975 [Plasmopara halstedii]
MPIDPVRTAAPEITNNTEDELAGNAEPGAVIVITDPVSDSVTSTVADADGHWSIQPNPAGLDAKDVVPIDFIVLSPVVEVLIQYWSDQFNSDITRECRKHMVLDVFRTEHPCMNIKISVPKP